MEICHHLRQLRVRNAHLSDDKDDYLLSDVLSPTYKNVDMTSDSKEIQKTENHYMSHMICT